eukprot:jgi/Ulvmu1/4481/UM002_0206.1
MDVKRSALPTFLRRLFKPDQMDYELTCWMMVQLVISPKTAYRHTSYHKQTKNQWARDDPAFLVVCMYLLVVVSTAYCIAFSDDVWKSILTILTVICIDFLGIGVLFSTLCWFISNRFLKRKAVHHHTSEQSVEWLYAFDVHCNSFIPMFLMLYVAQYFLTPILLWKSVFSSIISCLLYVAGVSYYHYMNFLGYSALPFLEHTEAFLWPVPLCVLLLPFLLLLGFNPSRVVLGLFFR